MVFQVVLKNCSKVCGLIGDCIQKGGKGTHAYKQFSRYNCMSQGILRLVVKIKVYWFPHRCVKDRLGHLNTLCVYRIWLFKNTACVFLPNWFSASCFWFLLELTWEPWKATSVLVHKGFYNFKSKWKKNVGVRIDCV